MPDFDEYSNADLFAAVDSDGQILGVLMIDGTEFFKREDGLWVTLDEDDSLYDSTLKPISYSPEVLNFDEGAQTLDEMKVITLG